MEGIVFLIVILLLQIALLGVATYLIRFVVNFAIKNEQPDFTAVLDGYFTEIVEVQEEKIVAQSLELRNMMNDVINSFNDGLQSITGGLEAQMQSEGFKDTLAEVIVSILSEIEPEGATEGGQVDPDRKKEVVNATQTAILEGFSQTNPMVAFVLRRLYGDQYQEAMTKRPEEIQIIMQVAQSMGIDKLISNFGGNNKGQSVIGATRGKKSVF